MVKMHPISRQVVKESANLSKPFSSFLRKLSFFLYLSIRFQFVKTIVIRVTGAFTRDRKYVGKSGNNNEGGHKYVMPRMQYSDRTR